MSAAPPVERRVEAERVGDAAVVEACKLRHIHESGCAQDRAGDPLPADPIAQLKTQRAVLKKELKDCTKQMRNEVLPADFSWVAVSCICI